MKKYIAFLLSKVSMVICNLVWETLYIYMNNIQEEIKGLANVEQVLLDTADSVMDTKRKIEFGVQQIIFKVNMELFQGRKLSI